MPRKRSVEARIAEHEAKGKRLALEKAIKDLRAQVPSRRRRRFSTTTATQRALLGF